jgi:hypothetical protein
MAGPAAADPATEPRLSVTLRSGVLSVETRAAPLVQVLLEVGRVGGVRVYIDKGVEASLQHDSVTATFDGVTVEEGLRRMLRGKNCILVYARTGLVEARVYSDDVRRSALLTPPREDALSPAPKTLSTGGDADTVPGDPAHLAVDAVSGGSAEVRIHALEEISAINDDAFVRSTMVAVLSRDDDPQVLATALEVLGQLENPPVEPVLDLLKRAHDVGARIVALDYLAVHGAAAPQVRAAIQRVVRSDRSGDVRSNARSVLGMLNDTGSARDR